MRKENIYKTDHFWERAWERGYNQNEIDSLIKDLKNIKKKTLLIFGKEKLRIISHKVTNTTHLVIVAKNNTLITLFEVQDLFTFLKANFRKSSFVIL